MSARHLVLVKHALPVMEAGRPARDWRLGRQGEEQARQLAALLRSYVPSRLGSSPEPKAVRTAEIVSDVLGSTMRVVDDLREIDRPVLPIMEPDEHRRVNAGLFHEPDRRVIGSESAREALERFERAIRDEAAATEEPYCIAVAHGTVIALLVGRHNPIDALELWGRLRCPSFVVVEYPSMALVRIVVDDPGPGGSPGDAGVDA